jgi:predicted flap endonuclease-1-like 5' DNA nuclease
LPVFWDDRSLGQQTLGEFKKLEKPKAARGGSKMMQLDLFKGTLLASTAQQGTVGGIPIWVILLVALVVVVIGIIWFLNEEKKKSEEQPAADAASVEAEVPEPPAEAEVVEPDDLTAIEGIGPKIAGLLQAAGITTYARLADAEVDQLRQMMKEADLGGIAHPDTWPQQAKMAAAGEWAELKKLQDTLKGGREV